ncbi:hypothetical protein [Acaryochloris sp. CCMEE 5410]|uniref:hypothetical protein n=1 Tax=Acaryochloris sp. CCMEE 5410 TaxID=310037 RepID=UPI0002483D70|nr:hypothetical protein [Acaryochloris sp. CCMEE 5410]KAI9131245.1 hypothetical protein ON05_026725 [Acaryochloris sp. CCMEE 5410]
MHALDGTRDQLSSSAVIRHHMEDLSTGFDVISDHLVKLCDAVLSNELTPESVEWIAFSMIASDHFNWDADTPDGERVAETLFDWSAPEVNYCLTHTTMAKFKHRLMTGEDTFDKTDFYNGYPSASKSIVWKLK